MLIEVQGDLLASDCDIIAHGCNCFHTMGSGIARQIAKQIPEALVADKKTVYGDINKLGTYSVASAKLSQKSTSTIKCVFNLYTQHKFGTDAVQVDYSAVEKAMKNFRNAVAQMEILHGLPLKVGIPRIGCGLAGGDWRIIKPLIEAAFYDHPIYVYSL